MFKEFHGKYYYMEVPNVTVGLKVLKETLEEPYKSLYEPMGIVFKCVAINGRHFVVPMTDGHYLPCCSLRGNPMYWYGRLIAFKQKVTNEYYEEMAQ